MEKIPILKMGSFLLVTIQEDMDDRMVMQLQDHLSDYVVKYHSKGVLIDISLLDIVDSFIGRMLGSISAMASVLGANTIVVGMQPAVAITIIELGLDLSGIQTALNVEKGMELLGASYWEQDNANFKNTNHSNSE